MPGISRNFGNNFYIYPIVLNDSCMKLGRKKILKTLSKNGMVGIYPGYQNIHLLKNLQKKLRLVLKVFLGQYRKVKLNMALAYVLLLKKCTLKN